MLNYLDYGALGLTILLQFIYLRRLYVDKERLTKIQYDQQERMIMGYTKMTSVLETIRNEFRKPAKDTKRSGKQVQ